MHIDEVGEGGGGKDMKITHIDWEGVGVNSAETD